jgi:osmotically-inducible protein OsmY
MRWDPDIKRDVEAELQSDPDIESPDIAVTVKDGVAALTGFTRSYSQKWQAEADVKRVRGVIAVANDIEVRLPVLSQRPDPEIARDIVNALKHELPESFEQVKAVVKDGSVTLEGEVEWNYLRQRAEATTIRVRGVRHIKNSIRLKPTVAVPSEIRKKIEEALLRRAEVDANRIKVEIDKDKVILRGKVRSWAESEEAERTAWATPGVFDVQNQIVVSL